MSRLVALTVVISLCASPLTFAGEGLMQSGVRVVQQQVAQDARPAPATTQLSGRSDSSKSNGFISASNAAAMQEGPAVLSKSGMSKRTKVMIYLAAGVGLAGTAWAIDHKVLDVTPSSLGTRRDGCKPFCGGSE
ncbi:MAG TPA: hypothetical protein VF456_28125 [Vicinamibacterales bacterium]